MPGTLELLPREQLTFQRMLDTIRRGYERFGFLPIETPAIELADVLLTKTGGETERQVYFVQSTGAREIGREADLALRFDLTVPLARYVAEHEHELTFPFRRYQIQRVYRGESPQRGRFREFYQCDVDVVGRETLSLHYDAEMPAVIDGVFRDLALGSFTIRLNNRRLMRGVLESLGIPSPDVQEQVLREVDKLDKAGAESVARRLADGLALEVGSIDRLLDIVGLAAGGEEAIDALGELDGDGDSFDRGRSELRMVLARMAELGVPAASYALDLSVARGLDYYTGTVYETVLDDHPSVGSICSGGRYDDLAGHYTSSRLPGVGLSIGFTRLFWQLRELGLVEPSPSTTWALVTLMDHEGVTDAVQITATLRESGLPALMSPEPAKLGKQLKYADRMGIRFAVIAGSDERARGTVTLRDLVNQTQEEVDRAAMVDHIQAAIRSSRE